MLVFFGLFFGIYVLSPRFKPYFIKPEMEFKEFEPRFKLAKNRFKLSAG